MSYPFCPAIRWGEFRARLVREYGVELRESNIEVEQPDGTFEAVPYLARKFDGRTHRVPCYFKSDDEPIAPTRLRYICQWLQIDPKDFGFELGLPPEDYDGIDDDDDEDEDEDEDEDDDGRNKPN